MSDDELLRGIEELVEFSSINQNLVERIYRLVKDKSHQTMITLIDEARKECDAWQYADIPF